MGQIATSEKSLLCFDVAIKNLGTTAKNASYIFTIRNNTIFKKTIPHEKITIIIDVVCTVSSCIQPVKLSRKRKLQMGQGAYRGNQEHDTQGSGEHVARKVKSRMDFFDCPAETCDVGRQIERSKIHGLDSAGT